VNPTVMDLWKAVVYDCAVWEHESLGSSNKCRRLPLFHIMAARNCKDILLDYQFIHSTRAHITPFLVVVERRVKV